MSLLLFQFFLSEFIEEIIPLVPTANRAHKVTTRSNWINAK